MYLFVNTAEQKEITVALVRESGQIFRLKNEPAEYQQSEKLLKLIKNLKFKINNLQGVIVVAGPGGFTALRIGLATANTIAWVSQIPIVGVKNIENLNLNKLIQSGLKKIKKIKQFKAVLPFYGQEPHITIKKK